MEIDDLLLNLSESLSQKAREPDVDGYKPLPYQIDFHSSTEKGRIILGGNRSGKSYSSVVEMIWFATGTHPHKETPKPPLRLRHVAVDNPHGVNKVLKDLYRRLTPKRYLVDNSFDKSWRVEPPSLTFANGSSIEFMSYAQDLDSHAGTSRHAIAFDEEPDEAIFNENLMRLIDTDGCWWVALTPVEGLTWLYERFYVPIMEEDQNLFVDIFKFKTRENSYLSKGAIDMLTTTLGAEELSTRLEGEFLSFSGLVYPKANFAPVEPRKGMFTFAAMDHGLRNPTAWLWFQADEDGNLFVVAEHYATDMLVSDHARIVREIEGALGLEPTYRVGDPSIVNRNAVNGQSVQTEYANHGIFIQPGNNEMGVGINRINEWFNSNRLYISDRCTHLKKEIKSYRWDEYTSRKTSTRKDPKARPKKKDDHAMDALRYGVMSRPFDDLSTITVAQPVFNLPLTGASVAVPVDNYVPDYQWRQSNLHHVYDNELGSDW